LPQIFGLRRRAGRPARYKGGLEQQVTLRLSFYPPIFCQRNILTVSFDVFDMLDDDIVYLGTRNNASMPTTRSAQRPVTGERFLISQTQT
jgi:hypothetical protein